MTADHSLETFSTWSMAIPSLSPPLKMAFFGQTEDNPTHWSNPSTLKTIASRLYFLSPLTLIIGYLSLLIFHKIQLFQTLQLMLPKVNPLIHFGLCNGTRSSPTVRFFSGETTEMELRNATREFFQGGGLEVDLENRTVFLTRIVKWYV